MVSLSINNGDSSFVQSDVLELESLEIMYHQINNSLSSFFSLYNNYCYTPAYIEVNLMPALYIHFVLISYY